MFQFQNISRAQVVGLDLGANTSIDAQWLNLALTFLYLNSKNLDTGLPLPYRSAYNVTGTVNTWKGHAGVDMRFRSAVEAVLAYPVDPRGNIVVFDLRLQSHLLGVLWQFKVSNLFNTFYVDVQERLPERRGWWGLLRYTACRTLHVRGSAARRRLSPAPRTGPQSGSLNRVPG